MKFFSTVMASLFAIALLAGVTPIKADAGEYIGDYCWNWSNQTPLESGTFQLGVTHIGGGHYLCSGVFTVTKPTFTQFPVHGNLELLAGKIYVTLSLAHKLRNNVLGLTMLEARLDPTNLSGTFEAINLFIDSVELSQGTLVNTTCQ